MDEIDKKILKLLQEDSAQPVADIARKIGLSVTPCWRRIQKLEEAGIIRKRVALLDGIKTGLGMSVFVAIKPISIMPISYLISQLLSLLLTRWWNFTG